MKISFIIPIYNAEEFILDSYVRIKSEVEKVTEDYEIIFRNDASSDKSEQILRAVTERDKKVKLFSNKSNRGLGYTLRRMIDDASGDIIVYLDADLSFDISALPILLKEIQTADVVVASKYTGAKTKIPFYRLFSSRVYYFINKILFGLNLTDIGSGFLVFKKSVLDGIVLSSDGFEFHIEFFTKIMKNGYKVKEISVKYDHRDYGSFRILKHGPKTLTSTLRYWWRHHND